MVCISQYRGNLVPGREGERKVIREGGDKGLEVKEGVERKDCHMFGILYIFNGQIR